MRIAICDIGSNTIKMKIYEYNNDNAIEVFSSVVNAKLISYIKEKKLSSDGLFLLCDTIKNFQSQAKQQNAELFYPFATASLRRCENHQDIIDTVYDICSVKIDLISGDEEAFLSFMGVKKTSENFPDNSILVDMGGGSTEIVTIKNQDKDTSHSLNFGSLSLSLDFDSFEKISSHVKEQVNHKFSSINKTENAILVGGTALAINKLYSVYFNQDNSFTLELNKLVLLLEYLQTSSSVIDFLKTHVPERATTVVQGLTAFVSIFEEFGTKNISVTTCGIREGYLFEKVLKERMIQK